MPKVRKRPTRAQLEATYGHPMPHKCVQCGFVGTSKYALKEHKDICRG